MKLKNLRTNPQTAASRPLALAATCFALGAAATASWFYFPKTRADAEAGPLSAVTQNALAHLATPVSVRLYSLLPAVGDEDLRSFSGRVKKLLEAVQAAGAGKIQVSLLNAAAETNAAAADRDGIQPFNLDKGDACYLGLAISGETKKEVLARLQPEWEPALLYDLVRAIQRVSAPPPPAPLPREVAKPSPEIISSINRLIPDVNAVSTEQADQIFHADFVKECGNVGAETEAKISAAEQQVVQAQTGGSAGDLAAAQKNLLQVQLAQGEKIKRLAADLQTRLAVFQQMKTAAGAAK